MSPLRGAILRGARRGTPHGAGAVAARAGDGYEFGQLREYTEGDDPRRIDWAATARIGALQTRVYLDDTVLVLAAVVDESLSMAVGRRRSLGDAAREAVAHWFAAAESGDRTRRVVDRRVVVGRRAAVEVRAREPFRLAATLDLAARVIQRSASLLVVTDGFDLAENDDRVLRRVALRHDATVLLARDPWRDGMPLRGFRRIRDAETGVARLVWFGRRMRARYSAAAHERERLLCERFRRAGWRVGALDERDGAGSLERAFGIRPR